jgi:hypothetical protein
LPLVEAQQVTIDASNGLPSQHTAITSAMAVVTLTNAVAWWSHFSPQPYSDRNRAERCDYEKEDAPNAAETYERFYSFEVHLAAPGGANSARGLQPRKGKRACALVLCAARPIDV